MSVPAVATATRPARRRGLDVRPRRVPARRPVRRLTSLVNRDPSNNVTGQYGSLLYLGTGDLATITNTVTGQSSLSGQVDYRYYHQREISCELSAGAPSPGVAPQRHRVHRGQTRQLPCPGPDSVPSVPLW